jgi:hypothetical protein
MLAHVVQEEEFVAMVERANGFRTEVASLGFNEIDAYVRARLYWNPKLPQLSAQHEALADEIVAVLSDSRLSSLQILELEREYFPLRTGQ